MPRVAAPLTAEAAKAREVFRAVPRKNVWHHSAFIGALGACGQWKQALEQLEHLKCLAYADRSLRPNHVTYSAAIAACARVHRLDVALDLFCEMQAAGEGHCRHTCTL
jgi:pentatricopeptide repeat protein